MSSPDSPTPSVGRAKLDHIVALDGLRAVAVLMVMWFHIPEECLPDWSARVIRVLRPGYFGVDFFFVLSGFLITRILIDYRHRGIPLRVFFVRRFLRIFPAYYLLIAIMVVVAPSWQLVCCAVYLANLAWPPLLAPPESLHHLWSLSVEEHFYLVWPLVVCLPTLAVAERIVKWAVLPMSIGVAVLFAVIYQGEVAGTMIWENTLPRSLSLALGGLLAFNEQKIRFNNARSLTLAMGLAALAGGALVIGRPWAVGDSWYVLRLVAGAAFSTGVVATVICLSPTGIAARTLSLPPLTHLGQISYGLYLYHHPIYYYLLWNRSEPPSPAMAAVAVGLSYAAAVASYHVWETPFLRLKDRWGRS